MKHCPDTVECHSQPRSLAFRKLSPQRDQQILDILPDQTCARRLSIDSFEDTLMPTFHESMISLIDSAVKRTWELRGKQANGLELPAQAAGQGAARPRHVHPKSPSWPGPLSKIPRSVRGSEWLGSQCFRTVDHGCSAPRSSCQSFLILAFRRLNSSHSLSDLPGYVYFLPRVSMTTRDETLVGSLAGMPL